MMIISLWTPELHRGIDAIAQAKIMPMVSLATRANKRVFGVMI
jgi:hypothetical protein